MKPFFLLMAVLFCAVPLSAQIVDSLLFDKDIFQMLSTEGPYGNRVRIVQPQSMRSAMENQISVNRTQKIQGFRIRIFSSNAQTARSTSQHVKEEFESLYPEVPAYSKFVDIDYRVLVGNFRTRSEAMRFHKDLTTRPQYRGAVIVREPIDFPPL